MKQGLTGAFLARLVRSTFLIASVMALMGASALGQATPVKMPLSTDLMRTYGACLSMRSTIKLIKQQYPGLGLEADAAQAHWDAVFKACEDNLDVRLTEKFGDKWVTARPAIEQQGQAAMKILQDNMTEDLARSVIRETHLRGTTLADSPVRMLLLASHPDFMKQPEEEIQRGFVTPFSTQGHQKANGVKLNLKVPMSWKPAEGDRPHIVQKWTSDAGHGPEIIMLQIAPVSVALNDQPKEVLFTEDLAREYFGQAKLKVSDFKTMKLEARTAGWVKLDGVLERLDTRLETSGISCYFLSGENLVAIHLSCFAKEGSGTSESGRKKLEPLFKHVLNSVVISGSR